MNTTGTGPRILAIILARGGSKSVPRKNIKPLLGKPMMAYTIEEALKSKYITKVVVSTEDEEIARVAKEFGAEVPFMRPPELATDTAASKPCLQHATKFMEDLEGQSYDYIIELMATNPLKTVEDIDACLEKLITTKCESVIGVIQVFDQHPLRMKKIVDDRLVDFCLPEPNEARRQDLKPDAFLRNGSIYSMRRDVLMVMDKRYGTPDSRPYIFAPDHSVNVDSPEDWFIAEIKLKERLEKNKKQ